MIKFLTNKNGLLLIARWKWNLIWKHYQNKQRQKLAEKGLFQKQGDALYGVLYRQLDCTIIEVAKNAPDFDKVY